MLDFSISPKHFGVKVLDLNNEDYLEFIRRHRCAIFGCAGFGHHGMKSDPHHVMVERRNDYLAIPLCAEHHKSYHTLGSVEKFNEKYNVDLMWMIINYLSLYISGRK